MDPGPTGLTPAKTSDASMDSVASPPASIGGDRPPKLKRKPEPPKNLSAMNLTMSEKDEEVAASVSTVLSETAAKDDKHTAASKVGHAVKEGTWAPASSELLGSEVSVTHLPNAFCTSAVTYQYPIHNQHLTPTLSAQLHIASNQHGDGPARTTPFCSNMSLNQDVLEYQMHFADIMVLRTAHVLNSLETGLKSKTPATRSGAFLLLTAISEICKSAVEPYLIPLVPSILDGAADKAQEVHIAALRAGRAIVNNMCPYGARFVLPKVTEAMTSTARWQQKNAACVLLNDILTRCPAASAPSLPDFFPPLRELVNDAREEVREGALAALQVALTLVNNRDLDPLLPVCFAIHCAL